MDVVSQLLSTVRLTGGGFLRADLHAPFAVETMNGRDTCSAFGRDFEQVIPYHVVMRGDCWVRVAGEPPVLARSGTVLLLPRGGDFALFTLLCSYILRCYGGGVG